MPKTNLTYIKNVNISITKKDVKVNSSPENTEVRIISHMRDYDVLEDIVTEQVGQKLGNSVYLLVENFAYTHPKTILIRQETDEGLGYAFRMGRIKEEVWKKSFFDDTFGWRNEIEDLYLEMLIKDNHIDVHVPDFSRPIKGEKIYKGNIRMLPPVHPDYSGDIAGFHKYVENWINDPPELYPKGKGVSPSLLD